MKGHHVKVQKTAHYYTLGEATRNTKYFWLVCHGYGQAADRFIRKFDQIVDSDSFILAPEGLSRFYWHGPRIPVSSWMTSKDRLDEIADYARYIQSLYDQYVPLMSPDVHIILLGFSQGVATQFRWVMRNFPKFHHLILWAGFVPEDLDYRPHGTYFSDKKLTFVYGNEDEFLTPERIDWHRQLIEEQNLNIQTIQFEGQHRIDRSILQNLVQSRIRS